MLVHRLLRCVCVERGRNKEKLKNIELGGRWKLRGRKVKIRNGKMETEKEGDTRVDYCYPSLGLETKPDVRLAPLLWQVEI